MSKDVLEMCSRASNNAKANRKLKTHNYLTNIFRKTNKIIFKFIKCSLLTVNTK